MIQNWKLRLKNTIICVSFKIIYLFSFIDSLGVKNRQKREGGKDMQQRVTGQIQTGALWN